MFNEALYSDKNIQDLADYFVEKNIREDAAAGNKAIGLKERIMSRANDLASSNRQGVRFITRVGNILDKRLFN